MIVIFSTTISTSIAQVNWTSDGTAYTVFKNKNIVSIDVKTGKETIVISQSVLIPSGEENTLDVQSFYYNNDNSKILLFANTAKVWRYNTRGDYWILDVAKNELKQLGKSLPSQSLMFAKFSPDGKYVGYVSGNNLFIEEVSSGKQRKLTLDGTRKLINGTFDWVYEEEFGCRDGFRWSPDSRSIAFWQVDARDVRDYYMLNTTDSVYSRVIPVEYPKVGEKPSPVRIGVVALSNGFIKWMNFEGDPQQHYIPRMEWSGNNELVVQRLDRKQQESKLIYSNTNDGSSRTFWAEGDDTWVDLNTDDPVGWDWVNKGQDFLWVSEKDGWRNIYKISRDGKTITNLTLGNYDIKEISSIDEANNFVYFMASPNNSTQLYLYRVKINNPKEKPELVSAQPQNGTHTYDISPTSKYAFHSFSNHNTPPVSEWVSLPDNKPVDANKSIAKNIKINESVNIEFLQVKTEDNIVLDAWINKPKNFDPSKVYPVVFYVYGEPGSSTTQDIYGRQNNFLYNGDIRGDGYIQFAVDNRGTPVLKGAKWRKSIYRKNGTINIRDMAMGAKKILELPYMDKNRVAVWGWSGGGSSTLHLLFQYPELFQTGISIAPVTNLLYYDNVYTERYMGLPSENMEDFIRGSAVNYAKNLKGNLMLIHGTADDNVHYSNAELLINELIKYNKKFSFMAYPNRSHSISEGVGTRKHLSMIYTDFLKANCAPGVK